jgi:hypothetical protein
MDWGSGTIDAFIQSKFMGKLFKTKPATAKNNVAAIEQEWDEINMAIRAFQNTSMRLRYSAIPVGQGTRTIA